MGKRLEQAIAEAAEIEAAEATADPDAPLPDHVKVSRPNRARSKVLQVRLNPEEMAAIERLADQRGLRPSTVARERLLQMIHEVETANTDVAARLAGIADQINELVPLVTQVR